MNRPSLQAIYSSSSPRATRMPNFIQPTRITISEADGVWRNGVVRRMEELIRLDQGWDGYKGQPVSLNNVAFALRMLEATCRENTPAPQVVPVANGELQIEWHTIHGDVELLVRGPNSVRAWHCLADGDEDGEEVELTNDFMLVATWVKEVTEPEIAYRAAA